MFQLRERVSLAGAETLLRSEGFAKLRETNETTWSAINTTVSLAKALGGYVPVRYYMHEAQEGFGRMKSEVMVKGMRPLPYVRMQRAARAALASEYYWDVDMENCQPSLLEQKLRQYNIACPNLTRYVSARDASLHEVMSRCGVTREEAKQLFIRLVFFGGVRGWVAEHPHAIAAEVPQWVRQLRAELKDAATAMLRNPLLADLKECHTKRGVSMWSTPLAEDETQPPRTSDPVASIMALFLQTQECECVRALVRAVQGDCRAVGGIIYDGILVEKQGGEEGLSDAKLRAWEDAVRSETGLSIRLAIKRMEPAPEWLVPASETRHTEKEEEEEAWMDGLHLLSYDEVKSRWEANTFKVVRSGNYVREEPLDGTRSVMSDKHLMESYRHLHYAEVNVTDSGVVHVSAAHPFIARWMKDPTIRRFREMVFAPPPLSSPAGVFNIWDGFAVERHASPSSVVHMGEDWGEHPSVRKLLEFHETLLGAQNTAYVLDWFAQIYQQPGKKTGIALLLKGEEGVGKNRLTDLHREMLGRDRFLQTATPGSSLYGRFNRQREGRLLIVINESNGADNFAANDIIKDMITCDEFQSEGKGTNSYTMSCYARFIFTTNNENCLRVNPDSRRYVVLEVSSALKGNAPYFNELTAVIEDTEGRYAFYRYLMARDLSRVDWINDRPVSEYATQMVGMNLAYEHQFFKHVVMSAYHKNGLRERVDSPVVKVMSDDLFEDFQTWLARDRVRYETTRTKFGIRITKLVRSDDKHTGFHGLKKSRRGQGVMYLMDVRRLVQELGEQRWLTSDEA